MHLITMAHLGEAQSVIDLFKLKRLSPHIFEGETITCLITGEGPFEAAANSALELGRRSYKQVINLGIAGSFSEEISVGSLHAVRSLYLVIDGKPQFKSFKSKDSGLDCVTSFERILSREKATPLSGIAQLIDREAWGVAMAAKSAGVPFESYKLISDLAGTLGACEVIKDKAQEWSIALALKLKELLNVVETEIDPLNIAGFYFTFSTKHQFEQMLQKIAIREDLSIDEVLASLPLEVLREEKLLPKERTRLLLNHMENKLDPLKEKLNSALEAWKLPFERQGIHIATDPTWEGCEIKISFSLQNQKELSQKLKTLSELNLKPFHDLRNGEVNVE